MKSISGTLYKGLRNINKLNKQHKYLFSNQQKKQETKKQSQNKLFGFIKSAWQQTFPNQQDLVRNKYKNVKQQKHFTKQQIQKIQQQIPQYQRTALTQTNIKAAQQKKNFQFSKFIPQSVKNKIKQSQSYKQMTGFKQNLKQYMSTRDGVVANAASMAYSTVANQSPQAKATNVFRRYIPDFNIYELERQSTVIFIDAYNSFLKEDMEKLQKMANQQALQYFKAHIKLNKTKKQTPYYKDIVFNKPATFSKVLVSQKTLPSFQFQIDLMQIYCMVDYEGKIVDGDLQRVNQTIFMFTLGYNGNHIAQLGHPWEITEIKKVQQIKLLV